MKKNRLGKIAGSLILLVFSITIAFFLGEFTLRLKNKKMNNYDIEMWRYARELKVPSKNPLLGHEHRINTSSVLQSVELRLNEWGMRGGPVNPGSPGKRRILVLGSSITLGWGIPENETMTALLEDKFRKDGEEVEVLNAGIGNYNTVRYVELFLTRLAGLEPTDIVVHYFINDAEKLEAGGGNFFLRHSQLAVTLWIAFNRLSFARKGGGLLEHYQKVYIDSSSGYRDMEKALAKLGDYARASGIRLYLAMTPDIHNLRDYQFGFIHEKMKILAERCGFHYIDFLPCFAGLEEEKIWAMPGDPHPNAYGHKLMAEALYPVLEEER